MLATPPISLKTVSLFALLFTRINFNRYFYRYSPPRPLEEIEADIRGIETDIVRMLSEVTGGAPASEPRQD